MRFYSAVHLITKPYRSIKQYMLTYALRYRNTFYETLESQREYNYLSLGILKKKENRKVVFKKNKKLRSPYHLLKDTYTLPNIEY